MLQDYHGRSDQRFFLDKAVTLENLITKQNIIHVSIDFVSATGLLRLAFSKQRYLYEALLPYRLPSWKQQD